MNVTRGAGRPHGELTAALSLGNDRLFAVVAIMAVAPLWIGPYLPLVDLPQHAGQITALQQLWSGDQALADLFRVNWFTPYLLGYLTLYLLSLVLPITVASQLLVSAAVISIPFLTGRLLRAVGADECWKWLAIPCSFSFAFYWGFLSFLVAAPFGLLFIIHAVKTARSDSLRSDLGLAAFGVFLFFSHIIVLGMASLVALGYVWGCHYRSIRTLIRRSLPFAAPLPVIAIWIFVTYTSEARVQSDPVSFGPFVYRVMQLVVQPAGREDLMVAPVTTLLVTGAVLFLPWLSGSRFSRRPERWLPFALGLAVFLVSPHFVLSAAYFYQRLGLFLVPLWLMAWDAPEKRRKVEGLGMVVVVLWVVASIGRFAAFARETESFTVLMANMEPGSRVASMVYDNSSPLFALPVYLHFPVWYQAIHGGVVDFNFADFYSQMVRYRDGVGPRIDEQLAWYPTAFRWNVNAGDSYDYFIVKANFDVSNEIFKDKRSAVDLVAQSGWWWLYRNLERHAVELESPR